MDIILNPFLRITIEFIVTIMLLKDSGEIISSVLDFLSKKLEKFEDELNKDDYQKTKEILGIEIIKREKKVVFYNIQCKDLDEKSLLEYIDSQNVRFTRQREELIDLSVKIANLNHSHTLRNGDEFEDEVIVNTEEAMEEVINHYKSGLPSGEGLRDMMSQIKERYPWSYSKKVIMIILSLVTCLMGIGLFVLDLYTDVQFSQFMFNKGNTSLGNDDESFNEIFSSFLSKNNITPPSVESCKCLTEMEMEFDKGKNSSSDKINYDDYIVTGWIALWHCIQPFVATLVVFISMNFCRGGKCSPSDQPEYLRDKKWWCWSSVLCCVPFLAYIGSVVPLLGLTNLFRFCLEVISHNVRSEPDFRTKIVRVEEKIMEHEAIGEL